MVQKNLTGLLDNGVWKECGGNWRQLLLLLLRAARIEKEKKEELMRHEWRRKK